MKIFAFADMHGNLPVMRRIKHMVQHHKPDLIIAAGDFTVFESHIQQVMSWMRSLGAPVYVIPGNHETDEITGMLCKKHGLVFAHKKLFRILGTTFLFHGGGGFASRDREFQALWRKKEKQLQKAQKLVFVTHAPPYGTALDKVYGHVGNRDYREFILKHKNCVLAISGHIHETAGKSQKLGKALIVNPGPAGKVFSV